MPLAPNRILPHTSYSLLDCSSSERSGSQIVVHIEVSVSEERTEPKERLQEGRQALTPRYKPLMVREMADRLATDPKPSHRGDGPQTVLQSCLSLWLQGICPRHRLLFLPGLAWPSVTGWASAKPALRWR